MAVDLVGPERSGPDDLLAPGITMAPGIALARGLLLAVAVLGVGTVAHVSGGGLLPSWGALVVLACLVGAPCVLLATGRRGPLELIVATVGGQGVVHAFLSLSAGHASPAGEVETGSAWGHLVDHLALEPGMAVAHALAAALVGWLLSRGEAALWGVVDAVAAVFARLRLPSYGATPALVARPLRLLDVGGAAPARRDEPGRGGVARRGPPVGLAAG